MITQETEALKKGDKGLTKICNCGKEDGWKQGGPGVWEVI